MPRDARERRPRPRPPRRRGSPAATRRAGCAGARRASRGRTPSGRASASRCSAAARRRVELSSISDVPVPAPSDWSRETRMRGRLGDDPHPDRELAPRKRSTRSESGIETPPQKSAATTIAPYGFQLWLREPDGAVGAEADERLLADRDEAAVAGERVPHHRDEHQDQQRRQLLRRRSRRTGAARTRARPRAHREAAGERRPRRRAPALDGEAAPVPRAPRSLIAVRAPDARRVPPRGEASTARKTRCPASTEYCGSICAPIVCATPSTMPPASVPQSEPRPPITTASNAKISCVGPREREERRADREEEAGDRGDRDGDRGRARVDGARVDADELRGVGVLCGRAHPPARLRRDRNELQAAEDARSRRRA